jgi:hypothetical protein
MLSRHEKKLMLFFGLAVFVGIHLLGLKLFLGFDQALEQGDGCLGVLVDPVGTDGQVFLRMHLPDLGRGGGQIAHVGLADPGRPGIPGGEGFHRAVLHALQRFWSGHGEQLHVPVWVHATGCEPVTDPEVLVGFWEGVAGTKLPTLFLAELLEEAR